MHEQMVPRERYMPPREPGMLAKWIESVLKCTGVAGFIGLAFGWWVAGESDVPTGVDVGVQAFLISDAVAQVLIYGGVPLLDHLLDRFGVGRGGREWYEAKPPRGRHGLMPDPRVNRHGQSSELSHSEKMAMARQVASQMAQRRGSNGRFQRDVARTQVQQVEAPAYQMSEEEEFFRVTLTMYKFHKDALTRRAFISEFGDDDDLRGGVPLYKKYVGPRAAEVHPWSEAGIWKKWHLVDEDGRGTCAFKSYLTLEHIFGMNADVRDYAQKQRPW